MAVQTDTLEIVNILVDGDVPRESAEALATILAEKFSHAVSEDQLSQQLALERERSDSRFDQLMQRMDTRIAQLEVRIYRAIAAATALVLAAISVWAAFG